MNDLVVSGGRVVDGSGSAAREADVAVADGVCIGHDAIIGAGAVVRGEIPPFQIAAGVPAQVVRDRRSDNGSAPSLA